MFLCAGSYTTYFVFSLSLSKTCCKVALNNWVLQKRKWMCQPDCIKLCLDDTQLQNHGGFTGKCVCCSSHMLWTESQWFCSPWYLGIWADRASSSMCFRERYHSGEGTWLSLLPPRGDILFTLHWSSQISWSWCPSKGWAESWNPIMCREAETQKYVGHQYCLPHWGTEMLG